MDNHKLVSIPGGLRRYKPKYHHPSSPSSRKAGIEITMGRRTTPGRYKHQGNDGHPEVVPGPAESNKGSD